ncbi:gustatory receptor 8a [Scaptodrosophila lebanonensis]|uniref:Gustatory receptor n=1 Tax=Drosophila lebanonensis TaxID=7225 RepID=A0A6J2UEY8_DROLE|nr:gustatory receptor 8a [Scaptodrosophila lebanonensis]
MMSGRFGGVLQCHLRFYQLCGFHTLSLPLKDWQRGGEKSWLLRGWAVCLLVAFSAVTLLVFTSNEEYLYQGDRFGQVNDGLKFCFAELAVVSIYAESLCRHRQLARFFSLYASLHHGPALGLWQQWRQHARYLIVFYVLAVTDLSLLALFWDQQIMTKHLLLFWTTFQPFICAVHLRNMQFVLHLELLRQQLVQMEQELALLADYSLFASTSATFVGFEDYVRRRLRQKQLQFGRIYEMSRCFQEAFGYSILFVLLTIYVRVLVDCYFMYYTLYQGINEKDYYMLLPGFLQIPAFIQVSQSCMYLVKRIAYRLHSIVARNSIGSSPLSLQIQNFSLQILHQNIRIHCLGIATIDGYLLTRIVCAISTYMVFFVQFMPKLTNFSN